MPRRPAPAPKANELIERLAQLADTPALDEFSLQRIARDANALMKSDPAGAHTVLGGVAALRGDGEETRKRHRTALGIDESLELLFNYSVSLSHLDENEEALNVAIGALKKYPDNLQLLDRAINVALDSANFLIARDLSSRWDALSPDRPNPLSGLVQQLADAVATGLFREEGIREVLRILAATQRTENVRTSNSRISSHNAKESFFYQRAVYAAPTLTAALNERLADQIVERSDLMADPGLRFVAAFTPDTSNGRYA